MDYARTMARIYKKTPDLVLNVIHFISVHKTINETYQNLVKQGEITRVEDLPEDVKKKYWIESKKYSTINEIRIEILKSLYLLDLLTNQL